HPPTSTPFPYTTPFRSLDGGRNIGGQQFSSSGARHDYDLQVINTATLNKPPVASATASVTSGSAPLAVAFNGAGSSDPDGTVVRSEEHTSELQSRENLV